MIPALFLVICVVAFRAMTGLLIHSGAATWLSNFAPLAAIALCCAAYLPRRYKFALPLLTLFISDLLLNATYHAPLFDPQILSAFLASRSSASFALPCENVLCGKRCFPHFSPPQ